MSHYGEVGRCFLELLCVVYRVIVMIEDGDSIKWVLVGDLFDGDVGSSDERCGGD